MSRLSGIKDGVAIISHQILHSNSFIYKEIYRLSQVLREEGINIYTRGIDGAAGCVRDALGRAFNPRFPAAVSVAFNGDNICRYIPDEERYCSFNFVFEQKIALVKKSKSGMVFAPGGIGVLDLLFETLCLIQSHIRKASFRPIILLGKEFWSPWDLWIKQVLLKNRTVSSKDIKLYKIVDSAEEAADIILDWHRRKEKEEASSIEFSSQRRPEQNALTIKGRR